MANTIGLQAVIDVTQFNQGLRLYIKGMLDMTQATQRASTQINSLGTAASAGLGASLGTVVVGAVQSVIGAFRSMASAIGDTISSFQGLALSLNFFAAQALQEVSPDTPLAEALKATRVEAQGLMIWVERLAVLSPFTAEQVGNAFRIAQAYGLSLTAAQKLVPLLVDFAAINNLSAELLQRVALATAQIQARGKLAAQEMNQLANAGFPIRNLLAKSLGVTRGELEKMLEDGLVPASAAIDVIIKRLEEFEGAAESVTRGTLQGIRSSLEDIVSISSRDLFGPLVSAFFPLLNQLIDIGNSSKFKAGMKVIGQELGEGLAVKIRLATSQVLILIEVIGRIPAPVLQASAIFAGLTIILVAFTTAVGLLAAALFVLINPFTVVIGVVAGFVAAWSTNFRGLRDITISTTTTIVNTFAAISRVVGQVVTTVVSSIRAATSSISELANTVVGYGVAVVESFTAGIMSAMDLLVDAMQFLGAVLAFWLAPGSPPRVAPNLDKWGTGSANVWLKGWLAADFDILSGISQDIGEVLNSLVSAEKLDELAAPRILRALRSELSNAVGEFKQFGKISDETLKRVAQSAGPAANQVKELLKGYVDLAVQTEAVAISQEKLNEISERYNRILDPLRAKLRDISELRQQADEQKEIISLNRLIANEGVGQARKSAASLRIQEIMLGRQVRGIEGKQVAEETAAEAEIKAAQKRKDIAEEQLERTKALIEVQNEQLNLYGQELQILEKIRKEQERLAREARQKMLEQLKKQLEIAQLLQAELKDAVAVFKAQHTLADATATAAEKAAAQLELQAILGRRIVRNFEAMELGIDPATIREIRDTLITLDDIGVKSKNDPFGDLGDEIFGVKEDTDKLVREMNEAMQEIRLVFRDTRKDIDGFLVGINNILPPFLRFRKEVNSTDTSLSDQARTVRAATDDFQEWPPLFRTLSTAFAGIASGLITSRVLTTLPKLLLGLGGPVGIVTALVSVFAAAWAGNWFDIRQVTADSIAFIQDEFTAFFESEGWAQFAQDVASSISTIRQSIITLGTTVSTIFLGVIDPILQEGFNVESIKSSLLLLNAEVIKIFGTLKNDLSAEARQTAQNIGTNIRTFLETYWNPFLAALLLSWRSVFNVFKTLFVEIANQFSFLPRLISFTMRTILTLVGLGLRGLQPLIIAALRPINSLILASLGGLGHLLAAAIALPFKGLGQLLNLNRNISFLITQVVAIFSSTLLRSAPQMWEGLVVGLFKQGIKINNVLFDIFLSVGKILLAAVKAPFQLFTFINNLTFRGFEILATTGINLTKILPIINNALANFGIAVVQGVLKADQIMIRIVNSVPRAISAISAFFVSIRSLATFSIPSLSKSLSFLVDGFLGLIPALSKLHDAFDKHLITIFTSAGKQSFAFLGIIGRLGAAIGGKFVTVFQQFRGVGPAVAASFKGLSLGLRQLSLIGSIKILEFFDSLSKGILSFAGKGQAKLGQALAGIFQGAFKGITSGIIGAPKLIGDFVKNINLAAAGKAIKGPAILGDFFRILASFKPGNIVKTLGSIFGTVKKVSGAFGGLLNPLNLLISAIDFFGFAFRTDIDGVTNHARGFVDTLKRVWGDLISGKLWQDISSGFSRAFAFISEVWTEFQANGINSPKLRTMLATVGTAIWEWIKQTGSDLFVALRDFWLPMFGLWIIASIESLGTTIGQILIFIRDWVVTAAVFLGGFIAETWTFFWSWWNDAGGKEQTLTWLQGIIDLVWGWIKTSAVFLYDNFIGNWLPSFVDWIVKAWPGLLTKLLEFVGSIVNWILTIGLPWLVNTLLSWATALIEWIGPALVDGIVALSSFLGGLIAWIIGDGIPLLVTGVIGLVKALIGWIAGDGEGTAAKEAPTELEKFLTAIGNFIVSDVIPGLIEIGKNLAQGVWDGFVELWGKIMATEPAIQFETFLANVQSHVASFREAGLALAGSLIAGINEAFLASAGNPQLFFFNLALNAMLKSGQEEIEGHSPSKLAKRLIGDSIAEGVMEGVTGISDVDLFKTAKLVDDLYLKITDSTTKLTTALLNSYTIFSTAYLVILNDLNAKSLAIWEDIRIDSIREVTTMRNTIDTDLDSFILTLQTSMATIKDTIVSAFTLANTESVTEVGKLAKSILGVLVGNGENDQNSVSFKVKEAMNQIGKLVGEQFLLGLIFVFTDTASLNPLWVAIDSLVDAIVARFQADLEVGSPSKLAANAIGKPITDGIGVGMMSRMHDVAAQASRSLAGMISDGSFASQFNSRPGTFMPSNVTNVSRNQEMNLYVTSNANSQGIISDFAVMRTMMR